MPQSVTHFLFANSDVSDAKYVLHGVAKLSLFLIKKLAENDSQINSQARII
jgi:hypothetical protein